MRTGEDTERGGLTFARGYAEMTCLVFGCAAAFPARNCEAKQAEAGRRSGEGGSGYDEG